MRSYRSLFSVVLLAADEKGAPIVIVAHSLGSVVMAEFLAECVRTPVDLLITLGSPLGLSGIHRRLKAFPKFPACVQRWVNASDPRDVVATVPATASLEFRLDRSKLRQVRRREGRYLLRTNLQGHDPAQLWTFYIQLTEVEQAFKELKHDLSIRPIYHHDPRRIEAHVFVAFLAYCLQVTLKANLRPAASGITPREVIDKFKTMQMVDVHLPTVDGRELILSRYTQPESDHRMLLEKLRLALPEQTPPKITANQVPAAAQPITL